MAVGQGIHLSCALGWAPYWTRLDLQSFCQFERLDIISTALLCVSRVNCWLRREIGKVRPGTHLGGFGVWTFERSHPAADASRGTNGAVVALELR